MTLTDDSADYERAIEVSPFYGIAVQIDIYLITFTYLEQ